jgi:hypothetical protein
MNNMRNIVVKADGGGSFWHQSPEIDCTKSMEVRDERRVQLSDSKNRER